MVGALAWPLVALLTAALFAWVLERHLEWKRAQAEGAKEVRAVLAEFETTKDEVMQRLLQLEGRVAGIRNGAVFGKHA